MEPKPLGMEHNAWTRYFAYGSNLSTTQMKARCPRSIPAGVAHLQGWKWIINERGFANVVKNEPLAQAGQEQDAFGQRGVYGLVYYLHPLDEETLDRCEGVPYAYERTTLKARWASTGEKGKDVEVLVYVDFKRVASARPREEYVLRMNLGIDESMGQWELPTSYVDDVLRPFIPARGGGHGQAGA
ncbi:hypothetical protein F5Y17DRAFT_40797 [Xylariaceae sp. FL0594]|nr:hypothetical protein F5Y17DRAFT_40797 [Xylariaceae sp. FL0594]